MNAAMQVVRTPNSLAIRMRLAPAITIAWDALMGVLVLGSVVAFSRLPWAAVMLCLVVGIIVPAGLFAIFVVKDQGARLTTGLFVLILGFVSGFFAVFPLAAAIVLSLVVAAISTALLSYFVVKDYGDWLVARCGAQAFELVRGRGGRGKVMLRLDQPLLYENRFDRYDRLDHGISVACPATWNRWYSSISCWSPCLRNTPPGCTDNCPVAAQFRTLAREMNSVAWPTSSRVAVEEPDETA